MSAFEQLPYPDLTNLDADDCEFLAEEMGTVLAAFASRANVYAATGNGSVALTVVELQQAVSLLQARAAAYRDHAHALTNAAAQTPDWPTTIDGEVR